jgi:hypothetical protein
MPAARPAAHYASLMMPYEDPGMFDGFGVTKYRHFYRRSDETRDEA